MQRRWWGWILGVVMLCTSAGADQATHRLPDQSRQRQVWSGDALQPYIVSGCAPTVPGALTLGAFACEGYVKDGTTGELLYVGQASAAVGPLNSGNGTYWVALHRDRSSAVSGWTRQTGTQYLWRLASTHPGHPSGGLVVTQVTVAGGVITAVNNAIRPAQATMSAGRNVCATDGTLNAAVTAVGSTATTFVIACQLHVTGNVTVPETVSLRFEGDQAQLVAMSAVTVTIMWPLDAPERHIFAADVTPRLRTTGHVFVRWFGAKGDGATDDAAAIQRAITAAQTSGANFPTNATVVLGAGDFRISTTLTITGANSGINIVGVLPAALQNGSIGPTTRVRFTGGAVEVFNAASSFTVFRDFAIDNLGAATSAVVIASGAGRVSFERMTFVKNSDGTRFTGATLYNAAGGGYGYIRDCEYTGASDLAFLEIAPGNYTRLDFSGNYVSAGGVAGAAILIDTGATVDLITAQRNTFDVLTNVEFLTFDSNSLSATTLDNVVFRDNEFTLTATTATFRAMKIKNINAFVFDGNNIAGGGQVTAFADVTASTIYARHNRVAAINGPLMNLTDTASLLFPDHNALRVSNTKGLVNNTTTPSGVVTTTYGTTIKLLGDQGRPGGHTVYEITATDNVAHTIQFQSPTDSPPSFMTRGQIITVIIRNNSGGAMGATTFHASLFLIAGATVAPANGFSRSYTFYFNGVKLVEISRGAADVAN